MLLEFYLITNSHNRRAVLKRGFQESYLNFHYKSQSIAAEDWKEFKKCRNQVTSRLRGEESNWQRSKLRTCDGKPSE